VGFTDGVEQGDRKNRESLINKTGGQPKNAAFKIDQTGERSDPKNDPGIRRRPRFLTSEDVKPN